MGFLKNLFVILKSRWQAMSMVQRMLAVLAAVALVATVIYLVQLIKKPDFAPLFSGLEPKEAGKITEELKTMKVPYRLDDQGKTIEVPSDRVYDLRIELASKGVLNDAGGAGFELFDQQKLSVTDFEQQVEYQRALQEELRRTIVQMEGVEQARIHLVMPKESLFIDNQVTSSASIALKLKPLVELKTEQVQGIVDLVVGSVQGLQPENVHIVDVQGNVLTDKLALKDDQLKMQHTMSQYQVRRDFEKELENRIQKMLTKVLGPNKVAAMVTADLDFDQRQSTSTVYQPGQVLSQQTSKEQGGGAGSSGGAPGTDTSQPGSAIPGLTGNSGNTTYSKDETTTNYQVGSQQETLTVSPGNIRRLSVAVVLDGAYSAFEIQQVTDMVRAAVGTQDSRGDQVNVSGMPFDTSYLEEAKNEMEKTQKAPLTDMLQQWPVLAGAGVLFLGIVLILMLIMRRRRKAALKEADLTIENMPEISELPLPETPVVEESQKDKLLEQLRRLAREKPAEVADVIKLLLRE